MDLLQSLVILAAGVASGAINAVVGSGTLVTFPVLVAFGVPPVAATMSNAVGLIPGNIAASIGYRKELKGQGRRIARLLPVSILGAITGAWLLLHLPDDAFETIVPALLILALIMVVGQPALQRYLAARKAARAGSAPSEQLPDSAPGAMHPGRVILLVVLVYLTAVYGGYFAAAQGIILIAVLGMLLPDGIQRLNAAKNVLVLGVNTVAATIYVVIGFDRINWQAAGLIAAGSLVGGYLGSRYGRKLSPTVLRSCIVVLGLVALWRILTL